MHSVIVASPAFDDDLGFAQCVEDLAVEQFISQARIEALNIAVLPWAASFDVGGLCPDPSDPVLDSFGHELRPVARQEVGRWRPWPPAAPITQAGGQGRATSL